MPEYIISQQLAQAILDYLVQQPFREVSALIAALQQIPVHTPPSKSTPPVAE